MYYAYKKIKEHRKQKAALAAAGDTSAPPTEAVTARESLPQSESEPAVKTETATETATAPTPEEKADKRRRRIYRWKLIAGLFGPFALQALDTTIIASALSNIATEFGASRRQVTRCPQIN